MIAFEHLLGYDFHDELICHRGHSCIEFIAAWELNKLIRETAAVCGLEGVARVICVAQNRLPAMNEKYW